MPGVRGVIFDLGSTLIRFRGEWAEVLARGRAAMIEGLRAAGYSLTAESFGEDLHRAFEANFRERRKDHRERAAGQIVQEVLAAHGVSEVGADDLRRALARLYGPSEACWSAVPGSHAVVTGLKADGFHVGLLSNASDVDNVRRLMTNAGFDGLFDPVVISAAAGVRKPTASLFTRIVEGWGLAPAQAVMVGDLLGEDILGAQRAGLHQIWVEAEADPRFNDEFVGAVVPEHTAESIEQVPALIAALASGGDPASGPRPG